MAGLISVGILQVYADGCKKVHKAGSVPGMKHGDGGGLQHGIAAAEGFEQFKAIVEKVK